MTAEVARFFAVHAHRYRLAGDVRMARCMEGSLSLNLLADYRRAL